MPTKNPGISTSRPLLKQRAKSKHFALIGQRELDANLSCDWSRGGVAVDTA